MLDTLINDLAIYYHNKKHTISFKNALHTLISLARYSSKVNHTYPGYTRTSSNYDLLKKLGLVTSKPNLGDKYDTKEFGVITPKGVKVVRRILVQDHHVIQHVVEGFVGIIITWIGFDIMSGPLAVEQVPNKNMFTVIANLRQLPVVHLILSFLFVLIGIIILVVSLSRCFRDGFKRQRAMRHAISVMYARLHR